jgi:predicted esterase
MAVLPKPTGKRPVVIWLHGVGGNIISDGDQLRQFAELGFNSVGIEFNETNQNDFDEQFCALNQYLEQQQWAQSGAIVWVGHSQGAEMTLRFILRHPLIQPQLYVRMAGGWVPELDSNAPIDIHCPVLLLHGQRDEIFPEADGQRLAALLKSNGVPVNLHVFRDEQPHGFGLDRPVVVRGVAEYCANFFGLFQPLPINTRPSYWYYWLPVFVLGIAFAINWYLQRRKLLKNLPDPYPCASEAIFGITWLLGVAATTVMVIHLELPRLSASNIALNLTRKWLVQPAQRNDFDWITAQPFSHSQKINTLLQHLELADLQRNFFYPELGEGMYRNYILSPVIEPPGFNQKPKARNQKPESGLNWRRELWENFYPRIRRETEAAAAAGIVVRYLRERVTITPGTMEPAGVETIWTTELTDTNGFEVVYVAALRAVGLAARLNQTWQAEFWNGKDWQTAPQPLICTWKDLAGQ